jgi:hypothetical protein
VVFKVKAQDDALIRTEVLLIGVEVLSSDGTRTRRRTIPDIKMERDAKTLLSIRYPKNRTTRDRPVKHTISSDAETESVSGHHRPTHGYGALAIRKAVVEMLPACKRVRPVQGRVTRELCAHKPARGREPNRISKNSCNGRVASRLVLKTYLFSGSFISA